jgi:hypothetical protein
MTTAQQNIRSLQGRYRPAVRRAWETVCEECHTDPADRTAYDLWYRQRLRDFAGIETTAGASAAQLETLIEAFSSLTAEDAEEHRGSKSSVPSAVSIPNCGFSPKQHAAFSRLVAKAWGKVQDVDPSVNYEAWFEARMSDAAAPQFGNNLFDRCMCIFGVIAGDEFWLNRTAEARERRIRYVIRVKLAELGRLSGRNLDWSYVQGIHDQAKLTASLDDCPAEMLRAILQILSAAIRKQKLQG